MPPSVRLHTLLRFALLGIALPCVYLGGAGIAFLYRQHAASAAGDVSRLRPALAPTPATRLLVFAPHCDDETLGCAGLMRQTLAAGGAVRAIMLTNGDGFRTAVERETRTLRVGPRDYIRFAALRQEESYSALEHLGLKRDDVLFFGYPDRGLMTLWNTNWTPERPYLSAYTRCDRSPYANTFDAHARYCGHDLIEDIKASMRAFHPTLVTVTHPTDDHPDHAAASAFVTRALQELQSDPRDAVWARKTRLRYYIIHRGDWPLPQGAYPNAPLLPPAEMAYTDTLWSRLPLAPQDTARKAQSIERYPSQTALMRRFLTSFARNSELYGEVGTTPLATVRDGSVRVDARTEEWNQTPPALLDPVRDNVFRDLYGDGDIRAVYACRDSQNLYLRLDTRQPISHRMTYTVRLRAFGAKGETDNVSYVARLRVTSDGHVPGSAAQVAARGRTLEASIPWKDILGDVNALEAKTLAISMETSLAGMEVDKTGIRFLTL